MRALVVLLALYGAARADHFGEQIEGELVPELTLVAVRPDELTGHLDPDRFTARIELFEAGLRDTKHPLARANLVAAIADAYATQGMHERTLAVDAPERLAVASEYMARARSRYMELFCHPNDANRGFLCVENLELVDWKNLPGVLLRFAIVLDESRAHDDAQWVYRRLVERFPKSRHAGHAHLAIGDYELARGEVTAASQHYMAATRLALPAKQRAYALYRRGWTEADLGDAEAWATFEAAAKIDPDRMLGRELRKGFVKAFTVFGAPEKAYAAFERVAPGKAAEMVSEVAERWISRGKWREAMTITSELLRRFPRDSRACTWQESIVRMAIRDNDFVRALYETEQLVRLFRRAGSSLEIALAEQCERAVVDLTIGSARTLRVDARALYDKDISILIDRLYALFLHTFPTHSLRTSAVRERANHRRTLP